MTAANPTEAASAKDWPRFPNAPIVEAVLDIQASFPRPLDVAELATFHEHIRDRYPSMQPQVSWELDFQIVEGGPRQALRRGPEGFGFKSSSGQRIVQVRQNGFALNWLKPYETWEAFRDEARPHWDRYCDLYRPESVKRLGLRYVNRIELPLPFDDFREYVKTAPDIASGLPQGLNNFLMRIEIPDPERGLIAILIETMQPMLGTETKRLPFIFDIDIVCARALPPSGQPLWDVFEQMRHFKNEIFFSSVTDRARELFR